MDTIEQVLKLINQTNQNVFLTGKAGTGKTTLLKKIVESTYKNYIIVAPTGIAAINAGGVTIHSMFGLPFCAFLPTDYYHNFDGSMHFETNQTILRHFKVRADKRRIINSLELLIIDEVSMLRPDVLDAMNLMLQYVRYSKKQFGGVQVLFIGDLLQLPPIIKPQEWDVMCQYYNGKFFFHAHALKDEQPIYLELTKIWRQTDEKFIALLQKLRINKIDNEVIETLSEYVDPNFENSANTGHIILTTHNQQADSLNENSLEKLAGRPVEFKADVIDNFPEHLYPIEMMLRLKKGAQVMFIKNDISPEKKYFNGKIGTIKYLGDEEIIVHFSDEKVDIEVEKYIWENKKYTTNPMTQEIEEEIQGTFTQYPLRLAWAITIHKSQGLTFEKAAIDVSKIFAPGQAYVALSRLTSLKGLKLLQPIKNKNISIEDDVIMYELNKTEEKDISANMENYSRDFLLDVCLKCFEYSNVKRWIERMMNELISSGDAAIISKDKKWLEEIEVEVTAITEVADKFKQSLHQILSSKDYDIQFLRERIEKAHFFFNEKWLPMEKKILVKLHELSYVSRVKEYENDIYEIEAYVMNHIKNLAKTKKLIECIRNKTEINKVTIDSKEVEQVKKSILNELGNISKFDLKSLIERKEPKKKSVKEIKKSTYELSFELWGKYRNISQIAEIRKLTYQTIFGHLVKFVEKGEIEFEELITSDKLRNIDKKIKRVEDFESITAMKSFLNDEFSYNELKLFLLWKKMMTN